MSFSIIIIGAGQIGSRHLQALSRSKLPLDIYVTDTSSESIDLCQNRWREMSPVASQAVFSNNIPVGCDYDLAIIATTSLVRAAVIKKLLLHNTVRYLILEKFLFPSPADYYAIGDLLAKKSVPAWVNCSRRMHPVYQQLHHKFKGPISLRFAGGEWGLGCNGIHLADLASWYTEQKNFSWDTSRLDRLPLKAKRPGVVEFSGELLGFGADGSRLSLLALAGSAIPPLVEIQNETARVIIDEIHNQGFLYQQHNNWQPEPLTFRTPFQSELSHLFVQDILNDGRCDLTSYEDSAKLHLGLLNAFLNFGELLGLNSEMCPIT